jgi:cell division protein FtsQ
MVSKKHYGLLLIALLLLALLSVIVDRLTQKEWMPLQHVRIEGDLRQISRGEIEAEIAPLLENGFFALDMVAISHSLERLSWVESVRVARIWPDTLQIDLREQVPYLKWGKQSYLSENGERFAADGHFISENLPELFGKTGKERELLAQCERLNEILSQQGLSIKTFRVTDRQSWQLILDNDIEILVGRERPAQVFERLMRSVALLGEERLQQIVRIDMRYPNGFAVQWKESDMEKNGMNGFLEGTKNV